MDNVRIKGACHCGAVTFQARTNGRFLVDCNCSICRKLGTLWLHAPPATLKIDVPAAATIGYTWADQKIVFHSCIICGCTTHWEGVDGDRAAVNMRLADPNITKKLPVRHWDGADTRDWLD